MSDESRPATLDDVLAALDRIERLQSLQVMILASYTGRVLLHSAESRAIDRAVKEFLAEQVATEAGANE